MNVSSFVFKISIEMYSDLLPMNIYGNYREIIIEIVKANE